MIQQTQKILESIYQLPQVELAENYLINQNQLQYFLGHEHPYCHADEVVVSSYDGSELEIGIFFHQKILNNLKNPTLIQKLNVIEGISHYLLLSYKFQQNIALTRLELEMQAEIDKFLYYSLSDQRTKNYEQSFNVLHVPINLESLNPEQQQLYQHANQLAKKYCHYLLKKFLARKTHDALLCEIRNFYRMPYAQKICYIEQNI